MMVSFKVKRMQSLAHEAAHLEWPDDLDDDGSGTGGGTAVSTAVATASVRARQRRSQKEKEKDDNKDSMSTKKRIGLHHQTIKKFTDNIDDDGHRAARSADARWTYLGG